jgi:PAS domain S-box-containing protein
VEVLDRLWAGPLSRQRLLLRGESMVASAGIALAALLMVAMAASAWWIHSSQRSAQQTSRLEQVQNATSLLAQGMEGMLARGELSRSRTLLIDTARAYHFSDCQVALPDGRVIASTDTARIELRELPRQWPGGNVTDTPATASAGSITAAVALIVGGQGKAQLRVAAPVAVAGASEWQAQAGIAGIGAVTLFALLVIYRRMRSRLRALGAIREALLMAGSPAAAASALTIASDLGPEAKAWNDVVADIEKLRKQGLTEKVREALGQPREVRNELESACDALSQGLLLIDEHNRVKYANGAAAVFLRTKREELTGADISRFLQVPGVLEAIKDVATGGNRRRVQDIERQDEGVMGVLRFSVRPVRREDSAAAMLTIEDITQQKVAEEARNNFVAQATHELRTPLTNIRLYVETAIEEGENDAATRAKCLNVINGEARRLERIVGEMLSVSEIEAGSFKMKRDDVRLDALFAELEADYRQQAEEKKVKLRFNLPPKFPVIQGDRDKFMLAMHNLIGNALKYTSEGGQVSINVEAAKGQLTVAVTDTGIGISPEDQSKVFERFYRAKDPRVAKITGTGLGLTLAREVARLHGGDITLESEMNRGSTFTLTVPAPAEAA